MSMKYVKSVQEILYSKIRKLLFWAFPDFMVRRSWLKRGKNYINEDLSDAYRLMYDMLANLCLKEKPKKILEYGCGDGYLLKEIFLKNSGNLNIEYVGIDYSPTQIENVKKFFKEGNFFVYDLTKGIHQFKDGEFDIVVGVDVLMYIQPALINNAISELHRICKNKLFLVEYYYKYLSDKKEAYREAHFSDGRCIYDYAELLTKHGFKKINTVPIEFFTDKMINIQDEMAQTLVIAEKE